ncbi:MAG: shikimate kinase [Lachnospiraceae bacterium]|nr:shikimate kinase [Lachnospiraceae bacterium]
MHNIILIGFMGCGKSTVGVKLSYHLRLPFLDTDKLCEQKMGKTIRETFEQDGESFFRETETEVLRSLSDGKNANIIATGGGLPLRDINRNILKDVGTVFYLRATPETIFDRIGQDTKRPLLLCEDPKKRIESLLKERDPIYMEAADHVIDVDGKDFRRIIREIASLCKEQK